MTTTSDLHNRVVGDIVRSIVEPALDAGGDYRDILVILESVIAGVILFVAKTGGDEIVLDKVIEGVVIRVKEIMAEARLGPMPSEGEA